MREYLSLPNLKKAAILGAIIALMAGPRIYLSGMDLVFFVPAAFLLMTLVTGAVTAWGDSANMVGPFPEKRRMLIGASIAAVIALIALPIQIYFLDPSFRPAIAATGDELLMILRYPDTFSGRCALISWSAGFEAVFFSAAVMSFFARLTNRTWIAVLGAVVLRCHVLSQQIIEQNIADAVPLFFAVVIVSGLISCILFARAGLPAVMIYAAGLNLNLLFYSG